MKADWNIFLELIAFSAFGGFLTLCAILIILGVAQ